MVCPRPGVLGEREAVDGAAREPQDDDDRQHILTDHWVQ